MSVTQTPQPYRVGRRLALLSALALVVALVALVVTLNTSPVTPQEAVAHIPVSTATPYPFATTSTPWKTGVDPTR